MKRLATVCVLLIVASLLVASAFDAAAQTIKVKNIGRSVNERTAPIKGTPAATWFIANGLRAVGVGSKSYMKIDTVGSGATGAPSWAFVTRPGGSTAALDSTGKMLNSFTPDLAGQYIISATVGGKTGYDTLQAATYAGVSTSTSAGCGCHGATATAIKASWSTSVHATIFKRGMTGNLEIERGKGAYAAGCIKCHTTGWDPALNNGNFGYQVKQTGWDTTWYKGLEFLNGDYWIWKDSTDRYNLLSAAQMTTGTIGCESCHGPSSEHKANSDPMMIGKPTFDADACNQCHDGGRRHSLGTFFALSLHEKLPTGTPAEGGRSSCQPCHTGAGFMYYLDHNKDTVGITAYWNTTRDAQTSISCAVCHDPHGNTNPAMLRTVSVKGDTFKNGYLLPANLRTSPGLLCANCHMARKPVTANVLPNKPPYYGFASRYGPHENPQADMLFGTGGYQYNDTTFTGLATHLGVEGLCVGCHMQPRMNYLDGSANLLPNHSFSMTDTTFAGNVYKPTNTCSKCHGEIEDFNDIKAFYDYDRNGRIEGVQTEVAGLLSKLKAILPKDSANGDVIGSGSLNNPKDTAAVSGKFDVVADIFNYRFVEKDASLGVHNSKYAVRLLYKALGWTPLFVKDVPGTLPKEISLDQNYPNPFNPSTMIRFSLPTEQQVKIEVYDMSGALVKTLLNEAVRAGNKEVTWDGTNSSGAKVASGMYLYRLQASNFVSSKKMLLLK